MDQAYEPTSEDVPVEAPIRIETEAETLARMKRDYELQVQGKLETLGVGYVSEKVVPALRPTLKVKRLTKTAQLPTRSDPCSIGLDLYADLRGGNAAEIGPNSVNIYAGDRKMIGTGLAVAVPDGHYGRVAPRSGLAAKQGVDVLAGVVDVGYAGQLQVILLNTSRETVTLNHGDRIAQFILEVAERLDVEEVDELEATSRGVNGFGSSGR